MYGKKQTTVLKVCYFFEDPCVIYHTYASYQSNIYCKATLNISYADYAKNMFEWVIYIGDATDIFRWQAEHANVKFLKDK